MPLTDIAALVAYGAAGLAVLSCALLRGRSLAFRFWCVVLGAFVCGWPGWVLVTGLWFLPPMWRAAPLAVPVLLLAGIAANTVRERRVRQLLGTVPVDEPEFGDDEPEPYPASAPLGEMAPPHDPWKALYVSLSQLRPKDVPDEPPAPRWWRADAPDPDDDQDRRYRGRHRPGPQTEPTGAR